MAREARPVSEHLPAIGLLMERDMVRLLPVTALVGTVALMVYCIGSDMVPVLIQAASLPANAWCLWQAVQAF
jgi:hypothetical protein